MGLCHKGKKHFSLNCTSAASCPIIAQPAKCTYITCSFTEGGDGTEVADGHQAVSNLAQGTVDVPLLPLSHVERDQQTKVFYPQALLFISVFVTLSFQVL